MRIAVLGGCGYVGSRLVPKLLGDGHEIKVLDIMWFGDGFLPHDNGRLEIIRGDIRNTDDLARVYRGADVVIDLACVSNDPSCQADPALSRSINIDAFEGKVAAAKRAGAGRYIYASSSSVYGVSQAREVTEDHPLVPLTIYNESKAECEKRLWPHQSDEFVCAALRPATVCGYAPRQRFDLTVNILTAHAARKGVITVFGGAQQRPNLHIEDMVDCYRAMIVAPAEKIAGQVFNVGRQNLKVAEIAELVRTIAHRTLGSSPTIETKESTDKRSYHVNSDKILDVLGFIPKRSVEDAIRDLCIRFKEGRWPDALTSPLYTNMMQLVQLGHDVKDSLAPYRQDRYA